MLSQANSAVALACSPTAANLTLRIENGYSQLVGIVEDAERVVRQMPSDTPDDFRSEYMDNVNHAFNGFAVNVDKLRVDVLEEARKEFGSVPLSEIPPVESGFY